VVDGVPNRSYRIQKLGNAVTPFIPWMIGMAIMDEARKVGADLTAQQEQLT
jgi:hypothetical protein